MQPVQPSPLDDALRRAMALGRSGQDAAARRILDDIVRQVPDQPDALQLLGMLARAKDDNREAAALFRRSLKARPGQAHVHNNLGNALLALGDHDDAIAAYRAAIAIAADYGDARTNLGIALLESGDAEAACETLTFETRRDPQNGKAWSALGRALGDAGRRDAAIAALRTALALRPGHLSTRYNLAVALRVAGDAEGALTLLQVSAADEPGSAEVRYLVGNCLQDLGRFDEAVAAYRAAIDAEPRNREAHDTLNRLLWQTGDTSEYLRSYADAIALHPDDAGLFADFAARLTLDQRFGDAITLLAPALGRGVESSELRHRFGQALWSLGKTGEALDHFSAAIRLDPANLAAARERARSLIILERYEDALATLTRVLGIAPDDQQAIAYRSLCLRLLGDARADWMLDPGRLIAADMLRPPPGEGDIASFNARLETTLATLHRMDVHPLEQTLRGGTQTIGDLLDHQSPEIRTVRGMIEHAVTAYIRALPDDSEHPFLRRKSASFRFSGSWSVRLKRAGFHMNHIHPEGWISACYYVGVPPVVNAAPGNQGWLKIGESALALGARERIEQLVQPAPGKIILFPSYFYHGTVPFEDDCPRTTIAFDVVPA